MTFVLYLTELRMLSGVLNLLTGTEEAHSTKRIICPIAIDSKR